MIKPRLVLCSKAINPNLPEDADRTVVSLDALGHDSNVNIKLPDIARVLSRTVPRRMMDLIELAAYVYTADAATRRGADWRGGEEPWARDLKFVIPIRDVEFWNRADVKASLVRLLTYLSDDKYDFEFPPLTQVREVQEYLELANTDWPVTTVPRVIMFSGGLDSLAGALESAALGEPLVLVSHRSVAQIMKRQADLVNRIRELFPTLPLLHVPVWINKANPLGHEPTQRTRSFLFGALGACTAKMVSASGVRFFENGVVSLNLPVADEVLRARASRTTNPHSLKLLAEFLSLVTESSMIVDNPYLYLTKAEVIGKIVDTGGADLIGLSVSCAHTMFKSVGKQHCGRCSQCIDRRTSVLAGGYEDLDPPSDYVIDVFTGRRTEFTEQTMAVHFIRHATELSSMTAEQFAATFNVELGRAVRAEPDASLAVSRIYEMHQRYARDVITVTSNQLSAHSRGLVDGSLDPLSLLGLVALGEHKQEMWERYAKRIGDALEAGIPSACKSVKPADEPQLQEIAEGILRAAGEALDREFPFLQWSSVKTKPDFSDDSVDLLVELKYVRKRSDIRPITEDVSADITKYGDGRKRTLFVIYDPHHLIPDDREFAEEILRRPTMHVRFIR